MGPRVGPKIPARLVDQVEDMNGALPEQLFSLHLPNGHRLDERGRAAVLGFHGLFVLIDGGFGHDCPNMIGLLFICHRPEMRCVLD